MRAPRRRRFTTHSVLHADRGACSVDLFLIIVRPKEISNHASSWQRQVNNCNCRIDLITYPIHLIASIHQMTS